jgi:Flp pilus assembly protein TadG
MNGERTDMVQVLSNLVDAVAVRGRFLARNRIGRLVHDRQGVAAIEFALVVPLMLAMCLVTWELALAIDTSRKVGRAGSTIGDLIAQQPKMSLSELEGIAEMGGGIIQPYNRSDPTIVVTALEIVEDAGAIKSNVAWSYKYGSGTPREKDPTIIPEKLRTPGSFIIRVDSILDYLPVISWEGGKEAVLGLEASRPVYSLGETYYLRPRVSQTIPCDDCAK